MPSLCSLFFSVFFSRKLYVLFCSLQNASEAAHKKARVAYSTMTSSVASTFLHLFLSLQKQEMKGDSYATTQLTVAPVFRSRDGVDSCFHRFDLALCLYAGLTCQKS